MEKRRLGKVRLKTDFVTNSSSVAFIVLVPNGFDIKKHLSIREQVGFIQSLFTAESRADYDYYLEQVEKGQTEEITIEDFTNIFDFKDGCRCIPEQDLKEQLFYLTYSFCKEIGLILDEAETGEDYTGSILLVKESYVKEFCDEYRNRF